MTRARDNPFSSDRVLAIRFRPQDGCTWPGLLARLEAMHYRAAIVGPKGTGKTTLLEDLRDHLESTGRRCRLIRLSSEDQRIPRGAFDAIARDEIILLDGAEQLAATRWAWLRWRTRRAAGVIVTSHTPGRLPTLLETRTTPQLLEAILTDLIPSSRPEPTRVHELFSRHRGNLRDALRELYDDPVVSGATAR